MAIVYNNNKVSVAATSTEVLPAVEGKRIIATLTNDSNETIYLGFNEAAVLNEGTPLAPAETLTIEEKDRLNVVINAISTSGTKNLAFTDIYLTEV